MTDQVPGPATAASHGVRPVPRKHQDKRRYPRVEVRVPVTVTTAEGAVLEAVIRNLSAEGLQIVTDPEAARILNPAGTPIAPGQGAEVTVSFELDEYGAPTALVAAAQLRHMTRMNADELAFGLQFKRLSLEAKRCLLDFFVECMRPVA